jgi:hypothetical protein
MFRSRKAKTEFVPIGQFSKDWANAGAEVERLGQRLDAVRLAKKMAKRNSWAKKHWAQSEQIILRKWKQSVRLHTVGLRQAGTVDLRPKIDYSWWEGSEEVVMRFPVIDAISNWIQSKVGFTSANFDRAWEMAKEEKLQKARQGLA